MTKKLKIGSEITHGNPKKERKTCIQIYGNSVKELNHDEIKQRFFWIY